MDRISRRWERVQGVPNLESASKGMEVDRAQDAPAEPGLTVVCISPGE